MELADKNINLEENIVYGGDKFNRSSDHSHGDLLALIDFKRNRIRLHKSEFQGTINAMERNTKLAGASILVTAGFILLLIFLFFWTASSGLFGIAFRGIVIISILYLIRTEIINIIKYMIHAKGIFMNYAESHNITPAGKALIYCAQVMSRLNICEQEIDKIESSIKDEADIDIDDLYNKLTDIDVEPVNVYEAIL